MSSSRNDSMVSYRGYGGGGNDEYLSLDKYLGVVSRPPAAYGDSFDAPERGPERVELLTTHLEPVKMEYESVAEQVFGGQMKQQRLSLEQLTRLMAERQEMHCRHAGAIWHRHYQVQDVLFGAKLHGQLDGYRRATKLLQSITQLDDQLRREEVAFWKDSMDLRLQMLEAMKEYDSMRRRASLLDEGDVVGGMDA